LPPPSVGLGSASPERASPEVQVLENRSPSAKPLRETPHHPLITYRLEYQNREGMARLWEHAAFSLPEPAGSSTMEVVHGRGFAVSLLEPVAAAEEKG
jgi:hypothetical protein